MFNLALYSLISIMTERITSHYAQKKKKFYCSPDNVYKIDNRHCLISGAKIITFGLAEN